MHPEMSLVLLTVLAGVGQGIFILLALLDMLFFKTGGVTTHFLLVGGAVALVFPSLGVAASFSHLGNPQRGWKAILKFKQSWLSREVVFLPAFMGFAALWLIMLYAGSPILYRHTVGALGIVAAIALYISSAMLYAAIRYIKEWANVYTPLNFTLFGLASGAAAATAVANITMPGVQVNLLLGYATAFLLAFSLVFKALAFQHNASIYPAIGLRQALGMNSPHIRLTDMGTTYEHYNTKEYCFPMTDPQVRSQQVMVLGLAFFLPLALVLAPGIIPVLPIGVPYSVAAMLIVSGLILERRLFFIQGNHLQNLYYGTFRSGAQNPILSPAKPGTPQPK